METAGSTGPARHAASQRWKWWLTIVLFLATVLTYLDRQTMSLCAPMITKEFKLSNEQYGQLVAAFRWAYAVLHIPAGYLADHVPIRLVYALAVGVWSLAGAAGAAMWSFRQLLVTRSVLGVGEAFNWPCATRIVANVLPPSDRGLGSGIFNSGAAVGYLIAPLIISPIAIHFGWRWAFFTIGSAGFMWIALWLYLTRRGSRVEVAVNSAATQRAAAVPGGNRWAAVRAWGQEVLAKPAFWLLLVVAVTVNPCWYFLNEWIPKYMHDQRAMGYLAAGLITVPIFVGADLGNLLSGGLVKVLTLRGWTVRKARGATLALATLLIIPVSLVTWLGSPYVCIALMGLAALGITSIVAHYTACMQDFSFQNVGIVAGINGMASNMTAALVNPYIGRYVDHTGNYTLIFVLMAALPAVSLAAILLFDWLISQSRANDATPPATRAPQP
jgi:ACS family hexuronate transporter-like MFS transporter